MRRARRRSCSGAPWPSGSTLQGRHRLETAALPLAPPQSATPAQAQADRHDAAPQTRSEAQTALAVRSAPDTQQTHAPIEAPAIVSRALQDVEIADALTRRIEQSVGPGKTSAERIRVLRIVVHCCG